MHVRVSRSCRRFTLRTVEESSLAVLAAGTGTALKMRVDWYSMDRHEPE
jgi:hypothetical protein